MSPFLVGYFNLVKSVLGSGLIAYPFLFSRNGLIPSILLTLISAFFSMQGLFIYLKLNHRKHKTMSTLADDWRFKFFINFIIVLKCVSVSISYFVMIKEIISNVSRKLEFKYPKVLFIAFIALTMPLSIPKQFKKLRFTSFLGKIASCIMIFATLSRFFTVIPKGNLKVFQKIDYKTLGSYVYTFTCHQNIFAFQNESLLGLRQCYNVIFCTLCSCIFIYFIFGISNAYLFEITPGFFDNIGDDKTTLVMQFCFLFMVVFSIPLQLTAAQFYLRINNLKFRALFVSLVAIIGTLIALTDIKFGTILSIIGGTVSSFMCFIISGSFYIFLGDKKKKSWFVSAILTLIFGLAILITTIFMFVKSLVFKQA